MPSTRQCPFPQASPRIEYAHSFSAFHFEATKSPGDRGGSLLVPNLGVKEDRNRDGLSRREAARGLQHLAGVEDPAGVEECLYPEA